MHGERIKYIIKNKGYSQREIADKLGVKRSTLSSWMLKNTLPIKYLAMICDICEVHPAKIFDGVAAFSLTPDEVGLIEGYRKAPPGVRKALVGLVKEL